MVTFLILGAGIGVVAGLSPGPVGTLVVDETLRAGSPRGVDRSVAGRRLERLLELTSLILAVYGVLLLNRALKGDAKRW